MHGFSFVPGELEQLKKALQEALRNNEKRRAIGEENRAYVVSNFSIEKIANDFKIIISNTLTA